MESAFGIDHGEVSKARRPPRPQGNSPAAVKVAEGAKKLAKLPGKAAHAKVSVAGVGEGASRGAEALGRAVGKKPGLTGAALLGGGAYAAYRQGRLKPKKA